MKPVLTRTAKLKLILPFTACIRVLGLNTNDHSFTYAVYEMSLGYTNSRLANTED